MARDGDAADDDNILSLSKVVFGRAMKDNSSVTLSTSFFFGVVDSTPSPFPPTSERLLVGSV